MYDNHDKKLDDIILTLYDIRNEKPLKLNQLSNKLTDTNENELKIYLKSVDSSLIDTECECLTGGGLEDLYSLSLKGIRLVEDSHSWKGWITMSYNKPIKLNNRLSTWTKMTSNSSIAIPIIIAFISVSINFLQWKDSKNQNNEIVKSYTKQIDSLKIVNLKKDSIIQNMKIKQSLKIKH